MERLEIGRFYAVRFDRKVFEFIVYNDASMDCPKLQAESINKIELKPRFELFSNANSYINPAKHGTIEGLIKDYIIEDYLFVYLKERNMITYSTDMAWLYDFYDKKGYDYVYKEKNSFKRALKKGPILVKQRSGKYN